MSDLQKRAADLLDAFAWGEALYHTDTPFYCERMMQMCRKSKRGQCACARQDERDAAQTWRHVMSKVK